MTEPATDAVTEYAIALLVHYGFELGGYKADALVQRWLQNYETNWVRLAIVEALYQGRYKAVSVEQILAFWSRRRRTLYHFNHEFERLVCRKLPQSLAEMSKWEQIEAYTDQDIAKVNGYGIEPATKGSEYPPLAPVFSSISKSDPAINDRDASADFEVTEEVTEQIVVEREQLNSENSSTLAIQQQAIVEENIAPNVTNTESHLNEDFSPIDALTSINNESVISAPVEIETAPANEEDNSVHTAKYEADWSRVEASKHPIHQFTPSPDGSDFYLKLKAVAQPTAETN